MSDPHQRSPGAGLKTLHLNEINPKEIEMVTNRLFTLILFLTVFTGCSSQPAFVDNGNPGQIKVLVYYDDNQNGAMDTNETGAQAKFGISQDISCPPASQEKITSIMTNVDGVGLFNDLKPGRYCVSPFSNGLSMTTKMTQEVYVSSDQELVIKFGVLKP
jgi:uncharacterized protein (DUF2141 family)